MLILNTFVTLIKAFLITAIILDGTNSFYRVKLFNKNSEMQGNLRAKVNNKKALLYFVI